MSTPEYQAQKRSALSGRSSSVTSFSLVDHSSVFSSIEGVSVATFCTVSFRSTISKVAM